MEIGVLGPVVVTVDGCSVPVERPKERALLAVIALGGGSPVRPDRITDALWSTNVPKAPTAALRAHVRRVRALLGRDAIITTPSGYACGPDTTVDAEQFRVDAYNDGDAAARSAAIARALTRWRGRPYDDLDDWEPVEPERRHLHEVYARAREEWVAARLELGETTQLVPLLEELVAEVPLAERRWELMMRALACGGRQADALRAFQRARRALGDAGLEPGRALVELDRAIATNAVLAAGPREYAEPSDRGGPASRAEAAIAASGLGSLSGLNPSTDLVQRLDQALDELPKAPTAMRSRLLSRLAVATNSNRDPALVSTYAAESLNIARLVDDNPALLSALYARLVTQHDPARARECEALAVEMLDRAEADVNVRVLALSILARSNARKGDLGDASRWAAEAEELAIGAPPDIVLATRWYRLFRATLAADSEAALAAADGIGEVGVKALTDPEAAAAMVNGIKILVHALFPDAGSPSRAPAIRLDEIAWPQANLGHLARAGTALRFARAGAHEAAREVLAPVTPAVLSDLVRDMYWPGVVWSVSATIHILHDEERAEALYPGLVPFTGLLLIDPAGVFLGCTDHHLGLLAQASNRPLDARGHFADATLGYERIGAHWWAGRVASATAAR